MPTPSATATSTPGDKAPTPDKPPKSKPKAEGKSSKSKEPKSKTPDKDKDKDKEKKTKTKSKKTGSGGTKRSSKQNGHAASPKPSPSPKLSASPRPPKPGSASSASSPAAEATSTVTPEPAEEKTPSTDPELAGAAAAGVPGAEGEEGVPGGLDGLPDALQEALEAEEAERAIAEELARRIQRVQAGSLDDLPPLPSRIVRIFTSSTFTDTAMERNALMENIYPKIKEYCRERHGLEFQVVDMRWGVRDEATDDHMTTELCMSEIDNCKRLSMGPNFVTFLGQKYGYRPVPTIIPASEYDVLTALMAPGPDDRELVDMWFVKDDNSVPPVYILQPISSRLVNFNNKRHQKLMETDQNTWWKTLGQLQAIFRKAAHQAFLDGKFTEEMKHNYFMAVTEREVRRAIVDDDTNDHKKSCLAYLREITNINLTALRYCRNYIDMIGRNVDTEAQELLAKLRDVRLCEKLPESNITRLSIPWVGKEGLDVENHKEYLEMFTTHFHDSILDLVDRAVEENQKVTGDHHYLEILSHLHLANIACSVFQGREEMMSNIEKYFKGGSNEPMILWGTSGCGKTSVLAKAYSMVPQWCPVKASPVMILRFLGTSPDSSTIVPMLTSISRQICHNYDKPADDMPTELSPLVQYFKKLLSIASKNKPLVIFLDSLDQLSAADGAHSLAWFPISMPPHVKCVVSTLPDYYGIMDTMKKMIYTKDNYIEILPLGTELACTVLKAWLAKNKRTVSEPQWVIVKEALEKCNLPLYIKLVYDEITRWKSYTPPDLTSLAHTIHDSIIKLFKRVENKHGKILVMHALSYLTASKSGLSEAELEDLLSCDEIVLNDVYQYHLPPVRRIPPLLWTRIRNDMPGYLSEREADGVNVINWYHRQFIEASKERYFRNQNFVMDHHSQIADYFIGMWGGGKAKPFEYSELQRQRFFLSESTGECDRKCPEQPLFFTDSNGQVMRFNLRKLSELPFHLVRSKRWDDLYKGCLFNFKWLHAKLCSLPLQTIIADFEDAHETLPDKEVLLVVDALRLSASVISKHPDMLGPQIVGRLLPYFHTHLKIQYLIKQCDDDGLSVNALDPSYHCLATPGGPLQYSLEGHPFAPFGLGITSDARYLVSVSNMFIIWDMSTGDVFRQISPGIQGIMQNLCISPDDKYAISYTNNDQIIICNIMTGDTKLLDKPVDDVETISGTTVNKTQLAVWTNKKWYLYSLKGELIDKGSEEKMNLAIIHVHLSNSAEDNCRYLVWRTQQPIPGVETDEDMTLQIINDDTEDFYFHSAIAISADRRTLYACIAISDAAVACYQKKGNEWKYDRTLGDNFDNIFCLTFDPDERYLVGTVALGYKLWDLSNDQKLDLKLPTGLRNIPNKNPLVSTIVFTRESEYCVAGVRNNIYVWSRKTGDLIKTLDAHFGRIIGMRSVVTMDANKVVSASIDKSIKIWNFNNILEDAFSIARHEKPIDQLSLASHAYIGATTTRNCVGIWNLESGKLEKTLRQSGSAIVTHAAITPDAQYVVAAESGSIICWDVDKAKVVNAEQQKEVQQLMLCDDGTKSITVSKLVSTKCRLVCRTIPNGEIVYQFDYNINTFKSAVITCDGLFLVVPSVGNKRQEHDVLSLYHAKTGTHMYDMNPKHPNLKEWEFLIAMPSDATHVALFDEEKGTVFDVKKKSFIRAVQKWQGVCTHNGRFGLYAPNRGGLELLDIKHGKVQHTLIPKVAEGVFSVKCLVTRNDQHVIYYHDGHRSIRVFRVSDGRQIADYRCPAEIRAMAGTQGGTSVVLGAVDGSVTVLTIADPKNKHNKSFLASLPSRNPEFHQPPEPDPSAATVTGAKAATTGKFQTVVQVARIAAKAKLATETKSRACVIC